MMSSILKDMSAGKYNIRKARRAKAVTRDAMTIIDLVGTPITEKEKDDLDGDSGVTVKPKKGTRRNWEKYRQFMKANQGLSIWARK